VKVLSINGKSIGSMHRTICLCYGCCAICLVSLERSSGAAFRSVALAPFMSAIFVATGVGLRQLPIDSEALIAEGAAHEVIGATSPARAEGKF
jgi:hypothetical protein